MSSSSGEPLQPYLPYPGTNTLAPVRPPLKWAGGKRQLIPQMRPYFPKTFARYHEPFLGSGAVFFFLAPQRHSPSFLSDLNPELVNFYRVLIEETEAFLAEIRVLENEYLKASWPERETLYYRWRNADRAPEFAHWSPLQRAVRFYFLNRTAYNGLYRTNQQGIFNVPWGRYKRPALYRPQVLENAAEILRRLARYLEVASFEVVLDHAQAGDFVYFDPPYAPLSPTSAFTTYTKEGFGADDQRRLASVCRELDRRNVHFLLSNSAVAWIRELYRGFKIVTVQARRNINSKGDKRGHVGELLVCNY